MCPGHSAARVPRLACPAVPNRQKRNTAGQASRGTQRRSLRPQRLGGQRDAGEREVRHILRRAGQQLGQTPTAAAGYDHLRRILARQLFDQLPHAAQ